VPAEHAAMQKVVTIFDNSKSLNKSMWKENLPESCPPTNATEIEMQVYRILKNKTPTEEDFIPYSIQYKDNIRYKKLCVAYAISFFNTREKAKSVLLNSITKGNSIGNYIGEFKLTKQDGRSEITQTSGHINTWLYKSWDLSKFTLTNIFDPNEN
jgi:hypothetical protein